MSLQAKRGTSVGSACTSASSYRSPSYTTGSGTEYLNQFERTIRLAGNNRAVCKTDAEYKANKLNRTEEVKLQNFKYRVAKAQEIQCRQFKQTENVLRVRSARLATKIKKSEDNWISKQRSLPSGVRLLQKRSDEYLNAKCRTCAHLQTIIEMYEREGCQRGIFQNFKVHSMCVFSNPQIKTFLKMLEAKYLEEVPGLKVKLRDSDVTSVFIQADDEPKISKSQVDGKLALKDVELRIRQFCVDLEHFNKNRGAVPKDIRESIEKVRISNAVVKKPMVGSNGLNIKEEVQRLLKL